MTVSLDKANMGRFSIDRLIELLGTYSFHEQTQENLLQSFADLDDDADGFISKSEMEKYLKTMGEGLSDDELNKFMELAIDPDGPQDKIDIRKITEILLPKMVSTNMLATRGGQVNPEEDAEAAVCEDEQAQ